MEVAQSNIQVAVNLLSAPRSALTSIKEKPGVLFPLLLIILTSAASMAFYFSQVDFAWMIDHMVDAQSSGKSPAEIDAMRKAMGSMSPKIMGGSAIVGTLIGAPIMFAIFAAYLLLVNKVIDDESLSFKHWYALVTWTSIPMVFTTLASFVNFLLASNGQLAIENINPLSFNNLFFHIPASSRLFGPINPWDPMMIWSQVLLIIGLSVWMKKSIAKSAAIALAPTLIIYGIWIAFALK